MTMNINSNLRLNQEDSENNSIEALSSKKIRNFEVSSY